jgi:uncharacterized protein (DUF2249 family)
MEGVRTHLVVVSLLFGTTKSGYAYSMIHEFDEEPLHLHLTDIYRTQYGKVISTKTSSYLRLIKEKQYVVVTYDAEASSNSCIIE